MLADFVKMTTATTGTGSLTLSAVSGFPTFADAFAVNELIAFTVLDDATGAPIESCIGHLSASTTLVIDRVLASYSAGTYNQINPTAVTLPAGTKRVICTPASGGLVATPHNIPALGTNNKRLLYPTGQHVGIGAHGSTGAVTQNIVYYVPIIPKTSLLIDAVLFRLTTVQASSQARAGVYTSGLDGKPNIKLAESSLISTATNSPPEIVCALGSSIRLKSSLHYLATTFTGGATGVTVNAPNSTAQMEPLFGGDNSMLASIGGCYEATTGGTLPATAGVTSGYMSITTLPLLAARLA